MEGLWAPGTSARSTYRRRTPRAGTPSRRSATTSSDRLSKELVSQPQKVLTPPTARLQRPRQPALRPRHRAAPELSIQSRYETLQINAGTPRQPSQHIVQKVTRDQRITARTGRLRRGQIPTRLSKIPATLGERRSNRTSPQSVLLNLPHGYTRQRGDATDTRDRNSSSWPPLLSAEALRVPTRHCPFGSACRHPATAHPDSSPGPGADCHVAGRPTQNGTSP